MISSSALGPPFATYSLAAYPAAFPPPTITYSNLFLKAGIGLGLSTLLVCDLQLRGRQGSFPSLCVHDSLQNLCADVESLWNVDLATVAELEPRALQPSQRHHILITDLALALSAHIVGPRLSVTCSIRQVWSMKGFGAEALRRNWTQEIACRDGLPENSCRDGRLHCKQLGQNDRRRTCFVRALDLRI